MVTYSRTRLSLVTVRESAIAAAFKPGGDIHKEMDRAGQFHGRLAQKEAPKRTGLMASTITYKIRPAYSRYELMYSINVNAPYAEYTLRDTGPRIWSKTPGGSLRVRATPYSWSAEPFLTKSVAGYRSIDWLEKATRIAFKGMRLN